MITAIITTYKRPVLLRRAVASILAQTYQDFKLVVYDNASGDETAEVMSEFLSDTRVTYHCHATNLGMMGNYAYAFEQIDTSYFSFLSDDDYVLPHFFETVLRGFGLCKEAAFSAAGITAITPSGRFVGSPLDAWHREGVYHPPAGLYEMIQPTGMKGKFPVPAGVLFQTQYARSIAPDLSEDIAVMWDPDYLTQLAARYPFVITRETVGFFTVHEQGYTTLFYSSMHASGDAFGGYLRANQKLIQHLKTKTPFPDAADIYTKTIQHEFKYHLLSYLRIGHPGEAIRAGQIFAAFSDIDTASRVILACAHLAALSLVANVLISKGLILAKKMLHLARFIRRSWYSLLGS